MELFIIFTERVQAANDVPRVSLTLASNRQFSGTEITAKPFPPYVYTPYVDAFSAPCVDTFSAFEICNRRRDELYKSVGF